MMRSGLASLLLLAAVPAFGGEILIGQSTPLSGANADLGNDIRNGALAYFKKVNDAGGLPQGQIRLLSIDDKNQTKLSEENTKKLVNEDNVVALFGYGSSTLSIPAMPTVREKKVPFFAPFTGADTIRKQNEFVYTVRSTYADEIGKIVNFWGNLGNTRVTVLHYDDTVGKENYETVAHALEKFGTKPVSVSIKRNADVPASAVSQVVGSNPNVLLITTLYAPAAQLIKQLKVSGNQYMVTSLSFAGASQLAKALGPDAVGVSVAIDVPTPRAQSIPVVKECTAAWAASGQKDPMSVTALESCIAAKVLVEGMKHSGKEVTRASLHRALDALGRYDAGGYVLNFKPGFHHGGSYVSIALLTPSGEVKD
jgi:branched-chain amino acid transport system substrate-binding protein